MDIGCSCLTPSLPQVPTDLWSSRPIPFFPAVLCDLVIPLFCFQYSEKGAGEVPFIFRRLYTMKSSVAGQLSEQRPLISQPSGKIDHMFL